MRANAFYNIVSEVDLHEASRQIQLHLEEQPKTSVIVPLRAVS
jgi:hypothetical protein